MSLFLLSKHSRKYFLSFWNLIDVLAIVLALTSSIAMRWQFAILEERMENANFLRGLLAITTGFLWLRVLSFLKAINIQLATFILAIITITKDILFFCVILLILVVSFSQMMFTLIAPSGCASSGNIDDPDCLHSEYLLQSYIMLLGDFGTFERERFATGFSVFILVLYSFLVTVILMNVLIAIASDSYEKCLLKSQSLFGRARVYFLAELSSFQSLLRKRDPNVDSLGDSQQKEDDGVYSMWWTSGSWSLTRNWSRATVLFFIISLVVTSIWTIAELYGWARGEKYVSILLSLSSVFVNIILYIIIVIFLGRNSTGKKSEDNGKREWNSLQRVVLRVLGASAKDARGKKKVTEEWYGRIKFLQKEMDRIADNQADVVNQSESRVMTELNQSESRVMAELNLIEERFNQTNASVVAAVDELKALISLAGDSNPGNLSPVPKEVNVNF